MKELLDKVINEVLEVGELYRDYMEVTNLICIPKNKHWFELVKDSNHVLVHFFEKVVEEYSVNERDLYEIKLWRYYKVPTDVFNKYWLIVSKEHLKRSIV